MSFGFKSFKQTLGRGTLGLALACAGWGIAQATPVVMVSASQSSVHVGDSFSIRFDIAGFSGAAGDSLSGFDINVLHNAGLASLSGYSFMDPASAINQLDQAEPASFGFSGGATGLGTVDAYGLSGNGSAALDGLQADSFRFLTLYFTALALSSGAEFSLDLSDPGLLFLDSAGNVLAVDYPSARAVVEITQGGGGQLPEPGALTLAGLALACALTAGRWRAAAAKLLGLGLGLSLLAGSALAQTPPVQPAANGTPIDAVVLQVQGARAKVRAAEDGREYWITVAQPLTADKVGSRIQGLAQARGDSIFVAQPAFASKP